MKEVFAIIQMNKMECTKDALALIGFPSFTAYKAYGRGKQRGLSVTYPAEFKEEEIKEKRMKYIPKRLLYLVVDDEDIARIVDTIIQANQTGHYGDGRIFICPVEDALRIRTGEKRAQALA